MAELIKIVSYFEIDARAGLGITDDGSDAPVCVKAETEHGPALSNAEIEELYAAIEEVHGMHAKGIATTLNIPVNYLRRISCDEYTELTEGG